MATKLAPDSLLTVDDQLELYTRAVGKEAADRQVRLARLAAGMCVCQPSKVRRRWGDTGTTTTRTVHQEGCPRRRPWMAIL